MPTWLTIVLALGGSAIISAFFGYIIKRALDKYFAKKDGEAALAEAQKEEAERLQEEKLRRERKEDVGLAIAEQIAPMEAKLDDIGGRLSKVEDGALSGLRNDILTCYYRCVEKGYRGDWDYENIHHMFDSYKELNGNSFVADVINRFDALPTKEGIKGKRRTKGSSKTSKSVSKGE